ncbi:MAG: hypothetical protein JO072_04130 [Parafilimonas sp.]|nr:hypothetical protein [Parafilimonas sp.]
MGEKGLYNPVVRRIVTIIFMLAILSGFLAIYYFTYLPQEHAYYNQRAFRILHRVAENFNQRLGTFEILTKSYKYQTKKDATVHIWDYQEHKKGKSYNRKDSLSDITHLDTMFLNSFRGNVSKDISLINYQAYIKSDSIFFRAYDSFKNKKDSSKRSFNITVRKSVADIIEPVISVHTDVFESFLLIKQTEINNTQSSAIVYESNNLNITNIKTDSLFKNKQIESPVINDFEIEGIQYKMYMLPFKVSFDSSTFIIAGVMSADTFQSQSESVPVDLLLTVCFVLIILLLALPFLKIFYLSPEENIKINDIRTLIVVIFIIPFFVTLVSSGIWLSLFADSFSTNVLSSLQDDIKKNFYQEIQDNIAQLNDYKKIFSKKDSSADNNKINFHIQRMAELDTLRLKPKYTSKDSSFDIKDVIFYPAQYKNFVNLHWMNDSGYDIASWNFNSKLPPGYFDVSDRAYFRDMKYGKGYTLPNSNDTFSITPVLSRLTGDYMINLAMRDTTKFIKGKKAVSAIAFGLSEKMYSIYNTIIPNGFGYCIINEQGLILSHSDTGRNLQENFFEEVDDSFAVRNVIARRDSAYIPDITLYEQPAKMIIRPLQGLPCYLITYYNKRGDYLFIFHILAFVFVCEAALLLFVSLFSYFMMLNSKKNSKLSFSSGTLIWLRPSADKKHFYIKNSVQLITCIVIPFLISLFFSGNSYYLYTLNEGLLLPLFAVTGYYIVKRSKVFFEKNNFKDGFKWQHVINLLSVLKNILLMYILSIAVFLLLQNVLFFNENCGPQTDLKAAIWVLIILMPCVITIIAATTFNQKVSQHATSDRSYLVHFIISLLLAVTVVSLIPAIIFTSYAFHEEKTLRLQTFQIDLAKKIQQRRNEVNKKAWQTKISIAPLSDTANTYLKQLKFEPGKGIYLLSSDDYIDTLHNFNDTLKSEENCLPFYKFVTKFLFLPHDHAEFYDDLSHDIYYKWFYNNGLCKGDNLKSNGEIFQDTLLDSSRNIPANLKEQVKAGKKDCLFLYYKNTNDTKTPGNFYLAFIYDHSYLFKKLTENYTGLLLLLALIVLMYTFYKIIYAVCIRVFLIGFFEDVNTNISDGPDIELKRQIYRKPTLESEIRTMLGIHNKQLNFAVIREKEDEKMSDDDDGDGYIVEMHITLSDVYEGLWNTCTEEQKYTLYDFATDGFTNYKKVLTLHQLYKAGLIVKEKDGNITLFTKSFRNFLLTKQASPEIKKLSKQGKSGSWGSLRTIFYIVLIAVAIFIFLSQEEASKRLITIVTSLGALLPAMLKLFDKSSLGTSAPGKGNE